MNLSKHEQRVLHILAQGGEIHFDRLANGKLGEIICYTREGYVWAACDTMLLRRLIQRRFVKSRSGKP
ncbi:MAG: YjhX family toxin, partial [Alphaproteobacteria bacterium]|nr:YjhX family toxin [Alphaproteobacteria bacterium]